MLARNARGVESLLMRDTFDRMDVWGGEMSGYFVRRRARRPHKARSSQAVRAAIGISGLLMTVGLPLGCDDAPGTIDILVRLELLGDGHGGLLARSVVRNTGNISVKYFHDCWSRGANLTLQSCGGTYVLLSDPCNPFPGVPCQGGEELLEPQQELAREMAIPGSIWTETCERVPMPTGCYEVTADFAYWGDLEPPAVRETASRRVRFTWESPSTTVGATE